MYISSKKINEDSKTYGKRAISEPHHKIHLHKKREAVCKSTTNQLHLNPKSVGVGYDSLYTFSNILFHFIPIPNDLSFNINGGFFKTRNFLSLTCILTRTYKSLIWLKRLLTNTGSNVIHGSLASIVYSSYLNPEFHINFMSVGSHKSRLFFWTRTTLVTSSGIICH